MSDKVSAGGGYPQVDGGYRVNWNAFFMSHSEAFRNNDAAHEYTGMGVFRGNTCTLDNRLDPIGCIIVGDDDVIIVHYQHANDSHDIYGTKTYMTNSFFRMAGSIVAKIDLNDFKKHVVKHVVAHMQSHGAQLPMMFYPEKDAAPNRICMFLGPRNIYQIILPKGTVPTPPTPQEKTARSQMIKAQFQAERFKRHTRKYAPH
jgi:hypothetical protein